MYMALALKAWEDTVGSLMVSNRSSAQSTPSVPSDVATNGCCPKKNDVRHPALIMFVRKIDGGDPKARSVDSTLKRVSAPEKRSSGGKSIRTHWKKT